MKKSLVLFLILGLILSSVPAFASIDYEFFYGEYTPYGGVVSGDMSVTQEGSSNYYVDADIYTVFTFNDILSSLRVSYSWGDLKDDGEYYKYFDFDNDLYQDNAVFTSDACTVNYTVGERKKVEMWYNQTRDETSYVETDEPFYYINKGASIRFNQPGVYYIDADYAGYTNMDELEDFNRFAEEYGYPYVHFTVNVKETEKIDDVNGVAMYDESLVSVSGITRYEEGRQIMYGETVAICSAPVVFEAKTDLVNLAITPMEQVNGQWELVDIMSGIVEEFIDGEWVVNMEESTTAHYDYYQGPLNKGGRVEITKPGIYEMWAESSNGNYTGMIFEIGDSMASYTNSKVLVDGKEVKFEAYNINDNNYFKLRDIAYALNGTSKSFSVNWDGERNKITMTSFEPYIPVGGELVPGDGTDKPYVRSENQMVKDNMDLSLGAYMINGNNYFKLRDLGKVFDFNVSWDGVNNCVLIDTQVGYKE